ncbi:MAG TPA: hypothetical protein PLR99_00360 [Polyangiaceae bacterium]|nr:hypothetical protein [Polyangiaceae bacterium]
MTCGEILMQRGEARGEAADVPTLETWADRVLTAASVDEVLGG